MASPARAGTPPSLSGTARLRARARPPRAPRRRPRARASRVLELVLVLPAHRAAGRHDQIELLVDHVEADAVPTERPLEVHVPVLEGALRLARSARSNGARRTARSRARLGSQAARRARAPESGCAPRHRLRRPDRAKALPAASTASPGRRRRRRARRVGAPGTAEPDVPEDDVCALPPQVSGAQRGSCFSARRSSSACSSARSASFSGARNSSSICFASARSSFERARARPG